MTCSQAFELIPEICRSERSILERWLKMGTSKSLLEIVPLLILSTTLYGASLGAWHGLEMACYVAIKFPLAILTTLCFTSILNGIIAALSGSGIGIRQSIQFQLTGFTILGIILASLSPLVFFLSLSAPAPLEEGMAQAYRIFLTSNVLIIAFAGVYSQLALFSYVKEFSHSKATATKNFTLWLLVNLLVGAEVTHTLRPFFGAPKLVVEFLREDMFERNFFESLYHVLRFII